MYMAGAKGDWEFRISDQVKNPDGRRGSRNIRQGGPDRLPHGVISEFRSY